MWLAHIRLGGNIYLYEHAGTRVAGAVERIEKDKKRACRDEGVTSREIVGRMRVVCGTLLTPINLDWGYIVIRCRS